MLLCFKLRSSLVKLGVNRINNYKMIKIYTALLLLVFFIGSFCHAIEVENLYKHTELVNNQSKKERLKAYRVAFQTILVRIAGTDNVLLNNTVKKALKSPTEYLSRYQYTQNNDELYLETEFNTKGINQLLRKNGFAIWGSRRPVVLAWLAIEDVKGKRSLIAEDSEIYRNILKNRAIDRGLPLLMPLLDFDDLNLINVSDVWGRFSTPIELASERYGPDVIAAISLSSVSSDDWQYLDNEENQKDQVTHVLGIKPLDSGPIYDEKRGDSESAQWKVDLTLFDSAKQYRFSYQHKEYEKVLAHIVDLVANELSRQYAISAQLVSTESESLQLNFAQVDGIAELLSIQSFLSTLSVVSKVKIDRLTGDTVSFDLELLGEAIDLYRALDLDERARKVPSDEFDSIDEIIYTWQGK